jgi:hypothetical protein
MNLRTAVAHPGDLNSSLTDEFAQVRCGADDPEGEIWVETDNAGRFEGPFHRILQTPDHGERQSTHCEGSEPSN